MGAYHGVDGSSYVSYEFGIPYEGSQSSIDFSKTISSLFPQSVHADSKSYSGCDSTISGCANLTFNFTAYSDHMYANSVSVVWTRVDSVVSFTSGTFGAACYADWYGASGVCNQNSPRTITPPSSGTTYSLTPSFAGSSHMTYYDDLNGQKAYQQLTMKRGSTTWTYSFCVAVGGGSIIYGCY